MDEMSIYGDNQRLTAIFDVTNTLNTIGCKYVCTTDHNQIKMIIKDPDEDCNFDFYFEVETKNGNYAIITIGDDGSIYTIVADSASNPIKDLPMVTDKYGKSKFKYQLKNNNYPKVFSNIGKGKCLYRYVYKPSRNSIEHISKWKTDFLTFWTSL